MEGMVYERLNFEMFFLCLTQYFVSIIILPLFLPYSSRRTYYFLCGYGLSRFKVTNHGPVEHLFKGCFYKGKGLIKASLLNLTKYVTVLSLFSFKLEQAFCSLLFYCLSEQLKQTFV